MSNLELPVHGSERIVGLATRLDGQFSLRSMREALRQRQHPLDFLIGVQFEALKDSEGAPAAFVSGSAAAYLALLYRDAEPNLPEARERFGVDHDATLPHVGQGAVDWVRHVVRERVNASASRMPYLPDTLLAVSADVFGPGVEDSAYDSVARLANTSLMPEVFLAGGALVTIAMEYEAAHRQANNPSA